MDIVSDSEYILRRNMEKILERLGLTKSRLTRELEDLQAALSAGSTITPEDISEIFKNTKFDPNNLK